MFDNLLWISTSSFLALCRIFYSLLLFISQQQGRWLWFFREIDVYLTWCYQSSSVVLKNEKMKLLQALNSCREVGTAVFLLHCVSFSAPQLNRAKQELSGFACHILHYGRFPSNFLPFSPKSAFNKVTLIIVICTARKLSFIHMWYTCKFSLSNKYHILVANKLYLLNFKFPPCWLIIFFYVLGWPWPHEIKHSAEV